MNAPLILYVSEQCTYCKQVEAYLEGAELEYATCNVSTDPVCRAQAQAASETLEVPLLIDAARNTAIANARDIIAYIGEHYSGRVCRD